MLWAAASFIKAMTLIGCCLYKNFCGKVAGVWDILRCCIIKPRDWFLFVECGEEKEENHIINIVVIKRSTLSVHSRSLFYCSDH